MVKSSRRIFSSLVTRHLSLSYFSFENFKRVANQRIVRVIFRRFLFIRQIVLHRQLQRPIPPAYFLQQRLDQFAVRRRPKDIHLRFLVRRKSENEMPTLAWQNVSGRGRISNEGFRVWDFGEDTLPNLVRITFAVGEFRDSGCSGG